MKNYFTKEERKTMEKYGYELIFKLKEIKPYKKRPRDHTNSVWKKIKHKIYDDQTKKNKPI